jgi:hypothetical protein
MKENLADRLKELQVISEQADNIMQREKTDWYLHHCMMWVKSYVKLAQDHIKKQG